MKLFLGRTSRIIQWNGLYIPFLVSLQVVWNGVQLLLGDQTVSENGGWNYSFSRLITVFTASE